MSGLSKNDNKSILREEGKAKKCDVRKIRNSHKTRRRRHAKRQT
jgi:hypothetical protein